MPGNCTPRWAGRLERARYTLLHLPTGAPRRRGVPFTSTCITLPPSDRLTLYTDGLVKNRDQALDTRLETLLGLLAGLHPRWRTPATCC
ncbi:SpoIIE family protein phosphatase [Streptomyces sp. NPDC058442]|uniref:SpoIIE family protein phosphatase n=1 Tax=Streptomyces sp. NPDC058442 TaxID=3346503 RepID=UPI00364DDA7C